MGFLKKINRSWKKTFGFGRNYKIIESTGMKKDLNEPVYNYVLFYFIKDNS